MTSMPWRHYSNDAKEADILYLCGLPVNGVKLGVFHTAIYGNKQGVLHCDTLHERLRTHKVFTKDQCFTLIIINSP